MSYLDTYFNRVFKDGKTIQERVKNSKVRDFSRYLRESVNRINFTCGAINDYGILLTDQYRQNKIVNKFLVTLESPLNVGDIFFYDNEPWLIYKQKKAVTEGHKSFEVIKCNYLVKWIDNSGIAKSSWVYLVSSMEDQVKQNFRTWHDMITPQENKYMGFIMPYVPSLTRNTRLIINDEGWFTIEIDKTSINNIMYVSLVESKVNDIDDDIPNSLAGTDELRKISLLVGGDISTTVGSLIYPEYQLYISDILSNDPVTITLQGSNVAPQGDLFIATQVGNSSLIYSYDNVSKIQNISVTDSTTNESFSIFGKPSIKLDREETYTLVSPLNSAINNIVCSIDNNALASIISTNNNSCVVHANDENKIGIATLTISHNGITYSKQIEIKPLW